MKKICTILALLTLAAFTSCATADTITLSDADTLSVKGEPIMEKETASEILEGRGLSVDLHMSVYSVKLQDLGVVTTVADAAGHKIGAICDATTFEVVKRSGKKNVWVALVVDAGKDKRYFRVVDPSTAKHLDKFDAAELRLASK